MPSPAERPTLESLLEQEFVEAVPAHQTLAVRTYLRWKIISVMVGVSFTCTLEQFVHILHHAQGLSIRDIAQAISDIMRTFIADRDPYLETAIHVAEERTELILHNLQVDVVMRRALIQTALWGSSKPGYHFNLEHRLTHISKNAVERLMRLLQVPMRDYSERHDGYGYRAKKRDETGRYAKARWRDPLKRRKIMDAMAAAAKDSRSRKGFPQNAR